MGVRFIYPNPDHPTRYVIVSTGVNAAVIRAASNLPEFLPVGLADLMAEADLAEAKRESETRRIVDERAIKILSGS